MLETDIVKIISPLPSNSLLCNAGSLVRILPDAVVILAIQAADSFGDTVVQACSFRCWTVRIEEHGPRFQFTVRILEDVCETTNTSLSRGETCKLVSNR